MSGHHEAFRSFAFTRRCSRITLQLCVHTPSSESFPRHSVFTCRLSSCRIRWEHPIVEMGGSVQSLSFTLLPLATTFIAAIYQLALFPTHPVNLHPDLSDVLHSFGFPGFIASIYQLALFPTHPVNLHRDLSDVLHSFGFPGNISIRSSLDVLPEFVGCKPESRIQAPPALAHAILDAPSPNCMRVQFVHSTPSLLDGFSNFLVTETVAILF